MYLIRNSEPLFSTERDIYMLSHLNFGFHIIARVKGHTGDAGSRVTYDPKPFATGRWSREPETRLSYNLLKRANCSYM